MSTLLCLGDSISDDGRYAALVDMQLRLERKGVTLINAGVSSETASGLSEPDHPFPRPCVLGRLTRALELTQPDWVYAMYGINDGIYYPYSADRAEAYLAGLTALARGVHACGARLALGTPTPYEGGGLPDGAPKYSYMQPYEHYNEVMARYAALVRDFGDAELIVDVFTPLMRAQSDGPLTQDGIHPGLRGHSIIAGELLRALFGCAAPDPDAHPALTDAALHYNVAAHARWKERIGHDNPNKSVPPTDEQLLELGARYADELRAVSPQADIAGLTNT